RPVGEGEDHVELVPAPVPVPVDQPLLGKPALQLGNDDLLDTLGDVDHDKPYLERAVPPRLGALQVGVSVGGPPEGFDNLGVGLATSVTTGDEPAPGGGLVEAELFGVVLLPVVEDVGLVD